MGGGRERKISSACVEKYNWVEKLVHERIMIKMYNKCTGRVYM